MIEQLRNKTKIIVFILNSNFFHNFIALHFSKYLTSLTERRDMNENLKINWTIKAFDELTNHELYKILQLRSAIFVVEQQCCYQDMDNKDFHAHHFMGWLGEELVAYTRLFDRGIAYEQEASIGRVIVANHARKYGLGRELMELSIQKVEQLFGIHTIKIGAQFYLKRFYESLGFQQISDVYMEDDIPHVYMIREA